MAFLKYSAPNIPAPPKEYQITYFNQVIRALNSFFNISNSTAGFNIDKDRKSTRLNSSHT